MFCSKCGKQLADNIQFCPNCGTATTYSTEKRTDAAQEKSNTEESNTKEKTDTMPGIPMCEERSTKHSPKKLIAAAAGFIVVLGVIVGFTLSMNDDGLKLISLVQDGYLGNYDTVTVREVLEYSFGNGQWNAGEAVNGNYYVVEYQADGMQFQFRVDTMDARTFEVSGIAMDGESGWSAYETKTYLDALYSYYAEEHRGSGIVVDWSTSNDTLQGHAR